jgi:protein-tyrosine phosphatase
VADATEAAAPDSRRWIELDGADNIRDLGGLAVAGGGRTRLGRLLRSGTLQDLTAGDVEHLVDSLGVRTVVDLRLADEAEREGSALAGIPALSYVSLPLRSADQVRSDAVADAGEMDVVGHYLAYLAGSGDNIVSAARIFAGEPNLPAVFHCAAGKDRTGVLTAVILDAIGVTTEAIMADYALTTERLKRIRARLSRLETYRTMMAAARLVKGAGTADAALMGAFLDTLRARHGGGYGFLSAHGMSASELSALRAALVED